MTHFGVSDHIALLESLGDDFRTVGPAWCGPELDTFPDGSWEGWWGERYANISFGAGVYPEAVYLPFKDVKDVDELKDLHFPIADWFDYSTIKTQCEQYADYAIVFGNPGYLDFINGIARCRGVEQVLMDIGYKDPVFVALMDQRYQFFYEMTERTLQAAKGLVDIVHVGEDFGTQHGLLISPRTFDTLFAERYKEFFAMVHRYGARVMMHSCGSVRKLIPRFIEIELDILDVVQVAAAGMDIRELHREFGDRLCFCGSVCVQTTLPFGSVEDVRREVELRQKLFPRGGLFLGPTHAIQVGTLLENILAMYRSAGSLWD
ncbi:MAG: uroporphyrinogen decarboxylase family protein [Chloroflexota bacterium]|nr:uroporphyrinogen decarboxylase family protein [Chloroflexota bacterium]